MSDLFERDLDDLRRRRGLVDEYAGTEAPVGRFTGIAQQRKLEGDLMLKAAQAIGGGQPKLLNGKAQFDLNGGVYELTLRKVR